MFLKLHYRFLELREENEDSEEEDKILLSDEVSSKVYFLVDSYLEYKKSSKSFDAKKEEDVKCQENS